MSISEKIRQLVTSSNSADSTSANYKKIGNIKVDPKALAHIQEWSNLPEGDLSMFLKVMKLLNINGTKIECIDFSNPIDYEIDHISFGGTTMLLLAPNVYGHPFPTPHIRIYNEEGAIEYAIHNNGGNYSILLDFVLKKPYSLEVVFAFPTSSNHPYPTLHVRDSNDYNLNIEFSTDNTANFTRIEDLEDDFFEIKSLKDLPLSDILAMVVKYYKDFNFKISISHSYYILWKLEIENGKVTLYQKNNIDETGNYLEVRRVVFENDLVVEYDIRNGDDERITFTKGKFSFETNNIAPKETLNEYYQIRNDFVNEALRYENILV